VRFEGTATTSPKEGCTGLWTSEDGRNLKLAIGFDSKCRPFLNDGTTPHYHCLPSRKDSGEHSDPPAYVHMSDKEAGRLYYLVQKGDRTLEYITNKYPHVINSTGAIWQNRLPQGEPFLLHREYSDDHPGELYRRCYIQTWFQSCAEIPGRACEICLTLPTCF